MLQLISFFVIAIAAPVSSKELVRCIRDIRFLARGFAILDILVLFFSLEQASKILVSL
jgi:hypothetical protein